MKFEGCVITAGFKRAQTLFEIDHSRMEAQGHMDGDVDERQQPDAQRCGLRPVAVTGSHERHGG
jgi:hypothetical protein